MFDIIYGKGISKESDILDLAVNSEIVDKSGAWYSYNGIKIGQGRENAKQYLVENPRVCFEIENKIREINNLKLLTEAVIYQKVPARKLQQRNHRINPRAEKALKSLPINWRL